MNPLGNGNVIVKSNPMLENIAQTLRLARSFRSPQVFMEELQRQNPAMAQQIMQLSQTVRNPMQAAQYMLAQQGITPEQIQNLIN